MKKKVGIITLFGYHNYGNKLQNYALQKILESLDFTVETIKNERIMKKLSSMERINNFRSNFKKIILNKYKTSIYKKVNLIRQQKFIDFSKTYLNETDYIISVDSIPKNIANKFDFFITGSDQVWNPTFAGSDVEFLSFAPSSKRISFAASFGVSTIEASKLSYYTQKLDSMASISVRENSGAEIVKKLTGKDVDILVDPTMLLRKDEWLEIIDEKKDNSIKDYIFMYFLGEHTDEHKYWIEKTAKTFNLKIIDVLDMKNQEIYTSDPSEFVSLINNAKLVCTDSFHGSVFSIIMETNFIIFNRMENNKATMGSRIDTLLEKFELTSRKWNNDIDENEILSLSFKNTKQILDLEKKKAISFLKKSLHVEI